MDKFVAELGGLCGGSRGLYGTFVLVHAVIKSPLASNVHSGSMVFDL